jgi:hypothetical protein
MKAMADISSAMYRTALFKELDLTGEERPKLAPSAYTMPTSGSSRTSHEIPKTRKFANK